MIYCAPSGKGKPLGQDSLLWSYLNILMASENTPNDGNPIASSELRKCVTSALDEMPCMLIGTGV